MTCRGFLQCLLKFLNFLLILIGLAITLYSLWMLHQWSIQPHQPVEPPSPGSQPDHLPYMTSGGHQDLQSHEEKTGFNFYQLGRPFSENKLEPHIQWHLLPKGLPAPWFIYAFFGFGVIVLLITCTGHIAAEISSGCCLSCYSFFLILLILVQAALATAIFFDHQWEEDIPDDPTGEFSKMKNFIEKNVDICKWVALGVVVVEVLSLLLALTLRPMLANSQRGYDSDDNYVPPRSSVRQPLLNRQTTQGNVPSSTLAEAHPTRNDAWRARMREKYGSDTTEFN
ncbi:hypothetical protein O6H91_16G072000 [Diphasiastrum complanatum]|uniref:Uncharacterized protein n=1 Tax=Diphasiastrum complanatum TaxID=34168 RepID=A0ACC2BDG4_DIPCM|nr:hypothetical protein O6H91_16G072000 [Diphasiastrum complanatum]